jgi:5-methylcytosine-specific restriction endonuclease McrA
VAPRAAGRRYCSDECLKLSRKLRRKLQYKLTGKDPRRLNAYLNGDDINLQGILDRHGDHCWLCDLPVLLDANHHHPLSAQIDHLIPTSKGGSNTWDNVALAHALCNNKKGARLVAFGRWGCSRPTPTGDLGWLIPAR